MEVLLRRVGVLSPTDRRVALDGWVEELFGERVMRRASGAPYLASGVGFSVSHTGDWLAVAFDRLGGRCGVDIELLGRRADHLAARFVGVGELELSPCLDNRALWVWCVKEALYKAAGRQELDWLVDIRVVSADCGAVCGLFFSLDWRIEGELLVVWAYGGGVSDPF